MTTKYDLAKRLLEGNLLANASYLMTTLLQAAQGAVYGLDYDELMDACRTPDYETTAMEFVWNKADLGDLETIADQFGDWSEVVATVGWTSTLESELDQRRDDLQDQLDSLDCDLRISRETEDGQADAIEEAYDKLDNELMSIPDTLEEWIDLVPGRMNDLRQEIDRLLDSDEDYKWVCENFDLDYSYDEVYEHWIVSPWLARKLENAGQNVVEICNLYIWGRSCTGQAVALDYVIQEIACELWGSEVTETAPSDA